MQIMDGKTCEGTGRRPPDPPGTVRAAVTGTGCWLPDRRVTTAEVEERLLRENPHVRLGFRPGTLARRTGIRQRRYMDPNDDVSDLAARAGRIALDDAGLRPCDVDLLVFASGSQDFVEPATAHRVNGKLGCSATVFDVKNACNSFLNGLEVAQSLLRTGSYRRALVCTGEAPSLAARWSVADRRQFQESFVGYTLGDAGAAVVLERRDDGSGIQTVEFASNSEHWSLCTLPGGGSAHWRNPEYGYFCGDGKKLRQAFATWGIGVLRDLLARTGRPIEDHQLIVMHQVSVPLVNLFLRLSGLPAERTLRIVGCLGNVASASIPIQLDRARRQGRIAAGDRVLLIGLGAGISLGAMTLVL